MATHSSILAWRISWTVKSLRLQRATFTFPAPHPPLAAWPGILFNFTTNGLLSGRQSQPRNGKRLSLCLFQSHFKDLISSKSAIMVHRSRTQQGEPLSPQRGQSFSPTPIKLSRGYSLFTNADTLLTIHRPQARRAEIKSGGPRQC